MALVRRQLEFKFALASGSFAESGGTETTLRGLRATAKIVKAGTPSLGEAQCQIFGVPLSLMKQLSTLGQVFQLIPRNVLTISAGDDAGNMSVAFVGTITQAWGAFEGSPSVPFHVMAHTLGSESVIAAEPLSFSGSTDAAGVMKTLAGKMGLTFENNGVNAKLSSPYLYGSPRQQADSVAAAGGFNWFADDTTLAVWPKGQARGGDVPVLAPPPEGQMQGYPVFTAYGISVKTLYDRTLKFGAKVQIKSSILPASGGPWAIMKLAHDLSCEMPGGDWFTHVDAFDPKYPQPVLG